ncbi:MAG TPA: ATP-binding protein [Mucilaginibacter sp.]|jgi:signal transduction histidine kinase|nr:ATP-binding protein [Mucilaginibacter sp.]
MKLSTQILLGFIIAIGIDLVDSYINYSLTLEVKANLEILNKSEAIIRNSATLNKDIVDMQNAFRGFLLTNDEQFLLPYNNGLKTIPIVIDQEKKLIGQSSSQHVKLDSIIALHNRWVNYANLLIQAKRKALTPAAEIQYQSLFNNQFRKQAGKSYNDQIADIFASFNQHEYNVREKLRETLTGSIRRTERFSLVFSILLIIIGSMIAFYLVKRISNRIGLMVKLAENISQGQFTSVVDNRNDELSSLSVSLNTMSERLKFNIHQLEKKNDELNQFAYVVSHDLKAPIRGINNVVRWINEDLNAEISPNLQKHLDIIPERLRRMENLIDGLLRYARIGSDRSTTEEVDVEKLIYEIAEVNVPLGCRLIVKNLPKLKTQKLLLEQVFSNLISNAAKYVPEKDAKIVVSCSETEQHFEFSVSDNGPGIDKEYHDKIFELFQTLREKNDRESTGIGLAIVRKIVEDRHCMVKVISTAGSGASFIFTWPKE